MLLAEFNAGYFEEYINRLQSCLKLREGDPEFTGYQKPTDAIFSNSKRMLNILCEMSGGSAKFCVTYDGKFEIRFDVFGANIGYIRVEENGYHLYNGYKRKTKFATSISGNDGIKDQLKRYMKDYL